MTRRRRCSRSSPRAWRCSPTRRGQPPKSLRRWTRFSVRHLLPQASDLEEDALVRALDELWRRHIVRVQADERWDFSHDRIREVAYSGIGPARRRLIHRRIAQGMEILFADRLDDVSASIAAHLDRGGQPARAVPFLERAAAVATRRVSARGGDPLLELRAVAAREAAGWTAIATSASWRCVRACRSR